jgi:hypothetical protein
MITIKEISQKNGINVKILHSRIKRYGIEPRKIIGRTFYFNNNIEKLITNKPPKYSILGIKKLKIMQYYLMFERQPKKFTADELGITYNQFCKVLKEWKGNDNCITIKSRL